MTMSARTVIHDDLNAIVKLQDNPGVDTLGQRSLAFVHPEHSGATVNACFDRFPQGAFVSENGGRIIGYANAIRLQPSVALTTHDWITATRDGSGISHDPAGSWLYVCRMLLTAGAGHQSLGPELSPILVSLKTLAEQAGLEGVAIALPFPGKRERSGTTEFQKKALEEGAKDWGHPHLSGAMGPSASINVALSDEFNHRIALPNYAGKFKHFALMVWRNPASG